MARDVPKRIKIVNLQAETMREWIQGARCFTRLDVRDGYYHLKIRKGDEYLTEYGLCEWKAAPFGLRNAPAQ